MRPSPEDIQDYVMEACKDGRATFLTAIANEPDLFEILVEELALEVRLRAAAAVARFCPFCKDLMTSQHNDCTASRSG